jgi:hypothetical protein
MEELFDFGGTGFEPILLTAYLKYDGYGLYGGDVVPGIDADEVLFDVEVPKERGAVAQGSGLPFAK